MTPMVDLAFLLLTFFVLTATFSKPKSMELTFPAPLPPDQKVDEIKKGITILLSKENRIFYYEGQFRAADDDKGKKTILSELDFSQDSKISLHKYLLENKVLQSRSFLK
jgi:biopolymer transport protein ExbD